MFWSSSKSQQWTKRSLLRSPGNSKGFTYFFIQLYLHQITGTNELSLNFSFEKYTFILKSTCFLIIPVNFPSRNSLSLKKKNQTCNNYFVKKTMLGNYSSVSFSLVKLQLFLLQNINTNWKFKCFYFYFFRIWAIASITNCGRHWEVSLYFMSSLQSIFTPVPFWLPFYYFVVLFFPIPIFAIFFFFNICKMTLTYLKHGNAARPPALTPLIMVTWPHTL